MPPMNNAPGLLVSSNFWVRSKIATFRARLGERGIAGIRIFVASFFVIALVSLLWLAFIPPKYSATAQLAPQASPENSPAISANIGGGLGALLGTKAQPTNLTAFQTLLGTAEFSSYLIEHDHLDKIIFPNGVHHSSLSIMLHLLFGQHFSRQVTPADMVAYLQGSLYLQVDDEWGYLKISYSNSNRDSAINFLRTVIYSGDRILRTREGANLNEQIHHLENLVATTTDLEQLRVFRNILGQKMVSKILIDTQDTYSFKIFDAPYAPSAPNSPNVAILILATLFLAAGGASLIALLWWYFRRPASQ